MSAALIVLTALMCGVVLPQSGLLIGQEVRGQVSAGEYRHMVLTLPEGDTHTFTIKLNCEQGDADLFVNQSLTHCPRREAYLACAQVCVCVCVYVVSRT